MWPNQSMGLKYVLYTSNPTKHSTNKTPQIDPVPWILMLGARTGKSKHLQINCVLNLRSEPAEQMRNGVHRPLCALPLCYSCPTSPAGSLAAPQSVECNAITWLLLNGCHFLVCVCVVFMGDTWCFTMISYIYIYIHTSAHIRMFQCQIRADLQN